MKLSNFLHYCMLFGLFFLLNLNDSQAQCVSGLVATLRNLTTGDTMAMDANNAMPVCKGITYSVTLYGAGPQTIQWNATTTGQNPSTGSIVSNSTSVPVDTIELIFTSTSTLSNSNITIVDGTGACIFSFQPLDRPGPALDLTDANNGSADNALEVCENDNFGTTQTFTSTCGATGTSATQSCYGPLVYEWFLDDNSGTRQSVGSNSNQLVLNNSTFNTGGGVGNTNIYGIKLVMTNGNQDTTGMFCVDSTSQNITVRPTPSFSSDVLINRAASGAVCVYGTVDASIAISNGGHLEEYTWEYRRTGTSSWNALNNYPAGAVLSSTTITTANPSDTGVVTLQPEISPYDLATNPSSLLPIGGVDFRVTVTNDYGCMNRTTNNGNNDVLTINDRPAVQILRRDGSSFSLNDGQSICLGQTVTLRQHYCDGSLYDTAHMDIENYSTIVGGNYQPNVYAIPYTQVIYHDPPCLNNEFFQKLTWGATDQNGTNLDHLLAVGYSAAGVTTVQNTATDNTEREVSMNTSSATTSSAITYSLAVEDNNGCTNSDSFRINLGYEGLTFTSNGVQADTFNACALAEPTIEASCFNNWCSGASSVTYTWTVHANSGALNLTAANTTTVGSETNKQMQTSALPNTAASGDYTTFQVTAQSDDGCTAIGYVTVRLGEGPSFGLSVVKACNNDSIIIRNGSHTAGTTYKVYSGITNNNGNVILTGLISSTTSASGDTIICAPNSTAGNTDYFIEGDYLGCTDYTSINFDIHAAPTFSLNTASITSACQGDAIIFESEATGGSAPLTYAWTATGVPSPTQGDMGTESQTAATGYFDWVFTGGWFPQLVWVTVSASDNNFTFHTDIPNQSAAGLMVSVTDNNNCVITHDYGTFEVLLCGIPQLAKTKHQDANQLPTSAADTFSTYACINDFVRLEVTIDSVEFTPIIYEWVQNGTTLTANVDSFLHYQVTTSSADTIFTICKVSKYDNANDSSSTQLVGVLFDTTVVSRGDVTLYPSDIAVTGADTSICLNEYVTAQAICPTCLSNVSYTWDAGTPTVYTSGNITDTYYTQGVSPGLFNISLSVAHGEGCTENLIREVNVNTLPQATLLASGVTVTGPLTLCTGETVDLAVDTNNCTGCTGYLWNTTATSSTITVASQGGYFAQVIDGNSCTGVSAPVMVLEASDGHNAPVVANPTQLCSGGSAVVEVAPCISCSYTWYHVGTGVIQPLSPNRTATVTATGDYYAEVTNAANCTYTSQAVTLTTTTLTLPSITGTTDSLCPGHTATLSTPSITGASYQWYMGGVIISGATDSSYVADTVGTYTVAVTYSNGCIEESPIYNVYGVTFKPTITAIDTVVCSGSTADLYTTQQSGWQYQWYNDGIALTNNANGSLYSATASGYHYVEVTTHYGCVVRSDSIRITTSSLTKPNAATTTPSICPGETATASVSLCAGCSYQWFQSGIALTGSAISNYRYTFSPTVTGTYYAQVTTNGGCTEVSDTITIAVETVLVPAINTTSSVVCDGLTATLTTQGCTGCSYNWLKDSSAIAGSLNDSFHIVTSVADAGNYNIAITYANGCVDTSGVLAISNGSDAVVLAVGVGHDSVICNQVKEVLVATPSSSLVGTYFYTLFLDNTPLTSYTSVTTSTFDADSAGVYTVQMVNPLGCIAVSNILPIREVNVSPTLTGRATSDPTSVLASGICTDSGTVYLEVTNCTGCSFVWQQATNLATTTVDSTRDSTYVILNENFDAGTSLPTNWTRSQNSGSTGWTVADAATQSSVGFTIPGSNTTNVAASNDTLCKCDMAADYLYTPSIDLTAYDQSAALNVDVFNPGPNSTATIEVSTVGATGPWTVVNTITPNAAWQNITVDLTPYLGNTIWIAFHHDDNGTTGDGFAIDSVLVTGTATFYPPTYTTVAGAAGTGTYVVYGTNDGCTAASNQVNVANLIGSIYTTVNTTDTSICDGASITLFHYDTIIASTFYDTAVTYRWMRNGNPISGATGAQFTTTTDGVYNLEITTTYNTGGCVDTSGPTTIHKVDPPAGLALGFDSVVTLPFGMTTITTTGTPLAANGSSIDMDNWVYPPSVRNDSLGSGASSYFTSTPYSGTLFSNAGLSGQDNRDFTPHDSLTGFHLVTYHYDTLGCNFTAQDLLEVLPTASIVVTNANTASVPYEACVGDVLTITTTNLDYPISEVYAFDVNDNYIPMTLTSVNTTSDTFGVNIRYNTTIVFTVPGSANASYLMLINPAGTPPDTTYTPFVLIHNTDLSFAGLPSMLCSNGSGITLYGNPQGGEFFVTDTTSATSVIAGAAVGDTIYPTIIDQYFATNNLSGNQWVDVYYRDTQTYTNGNLCPDFDTVSQRIEIRDVRLTGVQFNTISTSQDQELLTNLVYRVFPYEARANQPNYTIGFSGSFTNPAGSPTHYLPKTAGVGKHPLTYSITTGICTNSIQDSITIVDAPTTFPIPDTICRNFSPVTFKRDSAYSYLIPNPIVVNGTYMYNDIYHSMVVRSVNNNQAIDTIVAGIGLEEYLYDPSALPNTTQHDTLIVEYWFNRAEDSIATGGTFDSISYIVGQVYIPIFIENLDTVSIDTSIVQSFYCQENTLHLLSGNPNSNQYGGGIFTLQGGVAGPYQNGDTLFNNVINPYDVNHLEGATTTYKLYYSLSKTACSSTDSMDITITKGLSPSFSTATGAKTFCDSDPAVAIVHNTVAPDTSIWKIGGIPQSSYTFSPLLLDSGIHVVELQVIDTFGCSATATDTFTVYGLPSVSMVPALGGIWTDTLYCTNHSAVDLIISPSPSCPSFTSASNQYLKTADFTAGKPASWLVVNNAGDTWGPTTTLPFGGAGGAMVVDTSSVQTDSWLITDSIPMIVGHTYEITYMVRAGDLIAACNSGVCDAQMQVQIGTAQSTSMSAILATHSVLDNNATYVPYTIIHKHEAANGYATGNYYIGMYCYTPAFGRSLRLDDFAVRDVTPASCNLNGLGYVLGEGIHQVTDSLFQFNPAAAEPGTSDIKYIYTNTNGCVDSFVHRVTVYDAPAVSFGTLNAEYCENDATVKIIGSPVGGAFTNTLAGNLSGTAQVPLSIAIDSVSYNMNVTGVDTVTYTYTDPTSGCVSSFVDTVAVKQLHDSVYIDNSIDSLNRGLCIYTPGIPLNIALFTGSLAVADTGTFVGPGVRSGTGTYGLGAQQPGGAMFYADSAVLDMGHTGDVTISYIYPTSTGCTDTTQRTVRVHASPQLSFANLPDSICLNADSLQIRVLNNIITGSTGQINFIDTIPVTGGGFIETDSAGNSLPNFISSFDVIQPGAAAGHNMVYIQYDYRAPDSLGKCEAVLYDSVRIDTVPVVYFDSLQPFYCENSLPSIIYANPPYSVGSGYMQVGNTQINNGYYTIDPASLITGTPPATTVYPVYYEYADSRGCVGMVHDTFEIRPYPRVAFDANYQDTFCYQAGGLHDLRPGVTPAGGFFTDNLAITGIKDSVFLMLSSDVGPRLVTYHYEDSATTCSSSDTISLYLFSAPSLDFNMYGGCTGMDITFEGLASNLVSGVDSITSIQWQFDTSVATITTSPLDTSPITIPQITNQYTTDGIYGVRLMVQNQGGCTADTVKSLIISPSVNLYTSVPQDYFEDFQVDSGGWHSEQTITTTPNNVWQYSSSLQGNTINDPQNAAWVTIPNGAYQSSQDAWVYSPCFDFTNSRRPMVAFDLWTDMLAPIDGVVMEYFDATTNTWNVLGTQGYGINWYNTNFILSRPGATPSSASTAYGWTGGRTYNKNGDTAFPTKNNVRYRLDQFKGQSNVRFRIAFASASSTVANTAFPYEGVAFDNVFFGERTRNVLVEHFNNMGAVTTAGDGAHIVDPLVYNTIFNTNYGLDVFLIQYQTKYPTAGNQDWIHDNNSADPNSRTWEYSVNGNNQMRIDGRLDGTGKSTDISTFTLDADMLQTPEFDVRINSFNVNNQTLQVEAVAEALNAQDSALYSIHVAIVQDSFIYNNIVSSNNTYNMLSVLRKMLPTAAGTTHDGVWAAGDSLVANVTWDYSAEIGATSFDATQLEAIVFIQNMDSKEVFQAQTTQDLNRYTGTGKLEEDPAFEITKLKVYPNPSSHVFNVEFEEELEGAYNWRVIDVAGRILKTGTAESGTRQFTIDTEGLVNGAYFFVINNENVYAQRKLIVIKN